MSVSRAQSQEVVAVEINSERDAGSSWGIGYSRQEVGMLYVEKGGIEVSLGVLQKVALLGMARIRGKVFGENVVV